MRDCDCARVGHVAFFLALRVVALCGRLWLVLPWRGYGWHLGGGDSRCHTMDIFLGSVFLSYLDDGVSRITRQYFVVPFWSF